MQQYGFRSVFFMPKHCINPIAIAHTVDSSKLSCYELRETEIVLAFTKQMSRIIIMSAITDSEKHTQKNTRGWNSLDINVYQLHYFVVLMAKIWWHFERKKNRFSHEKTSNIQAEFISIYIDHCRIVLMWTFCQP